MRKLIFLLLFLVGITAAAWLGGETWLAREAARRIAEEPSVSAATVTPLREVSRIGLRLEDVQLDTPDGPAALPELQLYAAPTAPTEFHAALPSSMTLPLAGLPAQLGTTDAVATLRVSPISKMAVSKAEISSGPVTLNDAPVAALVHVIAQLTKIGSGAPKDAGASYEVSGRLDSLSLGELGLDPAIADEAGPLSVEGEARLFTTDAIVPGQPQPRVVGVKSDGVTVHAEDRSARIAGQLSANAEGQATGAVFIYTADPRAWLTLASAAGMLPETYAPLLGTMLEAAAETEPSLPENVTAPPPPRDGEMRIPLIFKDGNSYLGALDIGPAPYFPR